MAWRLIRNRAVSRLEGGYLVTYRPGDRMDASDRLRNAFADRVADMDTEAVPDAPNDGLQYEGGTADAPVTPDEDVRAVIDAPAPEAKGMAKSLTTAQLEVAAQVETRKGVGKTLNTLLTKRSGL